MDLRTTYLGLSLAHPFMPGACPLADDLDTVRRLEDAGAPAIVLRSLFEEQIEREQIAYLSYGERHSESFAEALTYLPEPSSFMLGPDEYLRHLARVKAAVAVPVIGSLNGTTWGGWVDFARLIQDAGADALELNVYHALSDPHVSGDEVEHQTMDILRAVKAGVKIPVAVKISPFWSSLAHMVRQLESAGADGLVLFNRFYQPDIDAEELQVRRTLSLSTPTELPLRLRWLALLSGRVHLSLAASGGVHDGLGAVKCIMAGAHVVQVVSALLQHGPEYLKALRQQAMRWMEQNEWETLAAMRGNMNLSRCPDPQAYERANYMAILQSWRG